MKRALMNYLGLLGIGSLLSYTAAMMFSPLAYPDYHWLSNDFSGKTTRRTNDGNSN